MTLYRRTIHILLLIAAMQAVSAFKVRCYWFCTDQTSVQTDYVAARDTCRQYAQLRLDTDTATPGLMDDRTRTNKLVSLFSACMADKGWTVPDGKGGQDSAKAPMASPATATAPAQPATSTQVPVAPVANAAPAAAAGATAGMATANGAIMSEADAEALAEQRREKTRLARQSECAFARHSAAYSSVAAARAEACDLECAERLKQKPKTRPAACPSAE